MAKQSPHREPASGSQPDLGAILETAPDAIMVLDAGSVIQLANQQTAALFGYADGAVRGMAITTLLPEWHSSAAAPSAGSRDLRATRSDGTTFPVEVRTTALATAQGMQLTVIVRDSTERMRVESDCCAVKSPRSCSSVCTNTRRVPPLSSSTTC